MLMQLFYMLSSLLSGALLPLQIGFHMLIAQSIGNPIWTTALSSFVGTVVLFLFCFATQQPLPHWQGISAVPHYAWLASIFGAFFVFNSIVVGPKLGAGVLVGLIMAGQMLISIFLDHYGYCGFPQQSLSLGRVLGVLMLILGVILIRKF